VYKEDRRQSYDPGGRTSQIYHSPCHIFFLSIMAKKESRWNWEIKYDMY